jgi:hypothetical protein
MVEIFPLPKTHNTGKAQENLNLLMLTKGKSNHDEIFIKILKERKIPANQLVRKVRHQEEH